MLAEQEAVSVFDADAENRCAFLAVDLFTWTVRVPELRLGQGDGAVQVIQKFQIVEEPETNSFFAGNLFDLSVPLR